ncbi:MAG TPA: iron-sulfur cluster repair di-iron protein [Bacteroidales bacterium]|jgi:regulator of cell morphogenesis and NO signaling|nr:iron-sulfur cluster repair di-iron protein [Bacteroidales bacterium]
MEINSKTIVGEIVKDNFRVAKLFDQNKIDYCCNGGVPLIDACNKANIDINKLLPEIISIVETPDPDSKYLEGLQLDDLCEYIVKRHHSYVNDNIPFLTKNLQKISDVHGSNHPELVEVYKMFKEASENLTLHMKKEELILFPYIKKLVQSISKDLIDKSEFGKIIAPISQMEIEHQIEGERFEKISQLTKSYSTPDDGCNTYNSTMKALQEFENDLHRHIHLENNILFKKAIELEKDLMN